MASIVLVSLLTLLLVLVSSAVGFICWSYYRAPIAELRDRYTYRPLNAPEHVTKTTGLQSPDLIPFEQLPGVLIVSLLLHEDDLFFCHRGFNWREIGNRVRAFLRTGALAGGSGITQQLAKNLRYGSSPDFKLLRAIHKLRETGWTLALERSFSKFEILSLYVDCVRLGPRGVFGFREAALRYFDCSLPSLSFEQIFFLVGILPRPMAIIRSLYSSDQPHEIRYRQAWVKFCDLYRLAIARRGWRYLDSIDRLPLSEAVEWMRCYESFTARGMSFGLEVALEARATEATERLRHVVEKLSRKLQAFNSAARQA